METTRRSGFVILVVFSALVQCQSQVLDCRGRSSLCVGPLSYKTCQDNGSGQLVTDDNPAQTCPSGTRCDNEGIDSCTPLKNPSAQTIEAPLSEESTKTTSKKSVDAESVSEVETPLEEQTTSNATTDIIIEQKTTTSPEEESELKNETISTEPQNEITPSELVNVTQITVDDSITPNTDSDSLDYSLNLNNTAAEKNNVTNAFNVTQEQVRESDQSYVENPSSTLENTTTSQQNLNGTTEETDNALLEPTISEQNVTGNFDENAENVTVSLLNDTISKPEQEETNIDETQVHQVDVSQSNRTEELSPETSATESTPAPSTSETSSTESTSEAIPTESIPVAIPVESTLPESTSPQASGNEEDIAKPEETLEETTPLEATVETNKTTLNETESPVAVTEQTIDFGTNVYQTAQNGTVTSTIPVDKISQESPTSTDIEVSEPGENAQQAPKMPEIDVKGDGSTQTSLPQSNVTENSEKDEKTPKDDSKISETNEHPIKVNGTEILHQEGTFDPSEKTHQDGVVVSDTEIGNRTESSEINSSKGQETTLVKATPEQTSQQSSKVPGTSGDEVKPNQSELPSRNTTQEQSPDSVTVESLPVQPVPQETDAQTSGVVVPQSTGTDQSELPSRNTTQEQSPDSVTVESLPVQPVPQEADVQTSGVVVPQSTETDQTELPSRNATQEQSPDSITVESLPAQPVPQETNVRTPGVIVPQSTGTEQTPIETTATSGGTDEIKPSDSGLLQSNIPQEQRPISTTDEIITYESNLQKTPEGSALSEITENERLPTAPAAQPSSAVIPNVSEKQTPVAIPAETATSGPTAEQSQGINGSNAYGTPSNQALLPPEGPQQVISPFGTGQNGQALSGPSSAVPIPSGDGTQLNQTELPQEEQLQVTPIFGTKQNISHTLQGQNLAAGESKPSLQTPQVSAAADKGKPAVQSIPTASSSTAASTVPNSQPSVDSVRPESTSGVQLLHKSPEISETGINEVKLSESEVNQTTTPPGSIPIPGNNGPLEQTLQQNPVQPELDNEVLPPNEKPHSAASAGQTQGATPSGSTSNKSSRPTQSLPEATQQDSSKVSQSTVSNVETSSKPLSGSAQNPQFASESHISPNNVQPNQIGVPQEVPPPLLPEQSISSGASISPQQPSTGIENGAFGTKPNQLESPQSSVPQIQGGQITETETILGSQKPAVDAFGISSASSDSNATSEEGLGGIGSYGVLGTKPNQLGSSHSSVPQLQTAQSPQIEKTTPLGSQKPVVDAFGISSASSESSATSEEGLGGIGSNGVLDTTPNQLGSSHSSVPQVQTAQNPQIEKTTPLGSQKPVVGAFGISSASIESSATSEEGLGGIGSNGVLGTKPNQLGSSQLNISQVQTAQSPQTEKTTSFGSQKPVVGAFGISSASSESSATSEEGLGGIGSNGVLDTTPNQLGSSHSSVPQVQTAQSPHIEKTTPLGSQKPVVGAFGISSASSESSATSEEGLGGIGSNGVIGTKTNQLGSSQLNISQVQTAQSPHTEKTIPSGSQKPVVGVYGISSASSESSATSEEGLNNFESNRPLDIKPTQLESAQSSVPQVTLQTGENTPLNSQKPVIDASGIGIRKPLSSSSSESNETSEEGLDGVESIESLESDQSSLSISSNESLSNNSKESKESSESSSSKSSKSSDKSNNSSSSSSEDDDESKEDKEKKKFRCIKEGRFSDPNNCKKYYICSSKGEDKLKKYHLKCDKHKGYDPDKNKCTKHFDKCD